MAHAQSTDYSYIKTFAKFNEIGRENGKISSTKHNNVYFTELHIDLAQEFPLTNTQNKTPNTKQTKPRTKTKNKSPTAHCSKQTQTNRA